MTAINIHRPMAGQTAALTLVPPSRGPTVDMRQVQSIALTLRGPGAAVAALTGAVSLGTATASALPLTYAWVGTEAQTAGRTYELYGVATLTGGGPQKFGPIIINVFEDWQALR